MNTIIRAALIIAFAWVTACSDTGRGHEADVTSPILEVGMFRIGESVGAARASLGVGQAARWGDHDRAIACRTEDAFLALEVVDGRIAGIVVARAPLGIVHYLGVTFNDTVAGLPSCRVRVTSLQWLGLPVFSGRPRTLPQGWAVDSQPSVANDGRYLITYTNAAVPYDVLRINGEPAGWYISIAAK